MSLRPLHIPLRIVFYREDGDWIAHCLECDLCGDGTTHQEALASLAKAIDIQVEETVASGNWRNLLSPADPEFFRRFAAGTDVARGTLRIDPTPLDSISFDEPSVREYADDDLVEV